MKAAVRSPGSFTQSLLPNGADKDDLCHFLLQAHVPDATSLSRTLVFVKAV